MLSDSTCTPAMPSSHCPHTHLEYGIASKFVTPGSCIAWAWLTSKDMFWCGVLLGFFSLSCQPHMLVALQSFLLPRYPCQANYHSGPTTAPALRVLPEHGDAGAIQRVPPAEPGGVPPTRGISLSEAINGFFVFSLKKRISLSSSPSPRDGALNCVLGCLDFPCIMAARGLGEAS